MRPLDTATLDQAARDYAGLFLLPNRKTGHGRWASGPEWAKQDLFALSFKDEFDHLVQRLREELGRNARDRLDAILADFPEREDKVFEALLAEKLAITPSGEHIEGKIGTTQLGNRIVGTRHKLVRTKKFGELLLPKNDYWPVYAGEFEERERPDSGAADALPEGAEPWPLGEVFANVTNYSAEAALLGLDALADAVDEGTTAANIRFRTGAQPADPDATETGTLLATLVCSDPAFNAGVDDTDGSVSAALAAVTDDSSADATGTAGYGRMAATGTGADDHLDGNCGTVDEAFVFNTVSFVAGSTVSLTSGSLGMSQGSTAS